MSAPVNARPCSLLPFGVEVLNHRAYIYGRFALDPSRASGVPLRAVCLVERKSGARRGESPRWQGFAPDDRQDLDYLVHAANAYPKLVAALRDCWARIDHDERDADLSERTWALLRELGEVSRG